MSGIQHNLGNGDGDEHHEGKQTTGALLDRIIEDPFSVANSQSTLVAKDLRKISMRSTPPHPSQIPSRNMVPSASTPPRTRQTSGAFDRPQVDITMDMSKEQMFELANMFQRLYYEASNHMKRELATLSGICAMQTGQLQQERIRAQAAGVDVEDPRPAGVPSVPGSQVVSRTGSRQTSGYSPSISRQAGNVFANRDPFTEEGSVFSGDPRDRNGSNDIPPSPPQSELQTHMAGRTPPPRVLHIDPNELSGAQTPFSEALQIDGQIDLPDDPALSGPLTLQNKPDAGLDTLNALDEALEKVANEPENNPPAATLSQGSTHGTAESATPQAPKGTEVIPTAHGDGTSGTKSIIAGRGSSPSQHTPEMDGTDDEPDIKLRTRTDTTNFGLPLGQVNKRFPSGTGNTKKL